MSKTPFSCCDAYKLSHWVQSPPWVKYFNANFTARRSSRPGIDFFVFFGLQAFLLKLNKKFDETFFKISTRAAIQDYVDFYTKFFGSNPSFYQVEAVRKLHELGYLPLKIDALPEGSIVPHGVPVFTIQNTHPDFHWITNFIESWLSAEVWQPCTSATTALYFKKIFDGYAKETSDLDFMPSFQGHDFSFRGMAGGEAAAASGAGHLLSFKGTDTCPTIEWIEDYYGGSPDDELIGTSVPATEHSVMCAGGKSTELETFDRLLQIYPEGILSVVSDTWDFWQVVTVILPQLKDKIMARNGKVVIRPDSGDPVKIICGDPDAHEGSPENRGLIQCLYGIFGGTENSKGYIELDSHIGAIYGDGINLARQKAMCEGLKAKKFSTTNIVLGIGSYTYQHVTRDTHGLAIKSTAIAGVDHKWLPIFKDPKTDNSGKKSAKGLLAVRWNKVNKVYELFEGVEEEEPTDLKNVYLNGKLINFSSFSKVRTNLDECKKAMEIW